MSEFTFFYNLSKFLKVLIGTNSPFSLVDELETVIQPKLIYTYVHNSTLRSNRTTLM